MKTEEIKVRVDPLSKSALVQIATEEDVDLSDIVRRAFRNLISEHSRPASRKANLSRHSRHVR